MTSYRPPPNLSPLPPLPPAMYTPASTSLAERINTATRKQHTQLNRLLTQWLPRCLPPHAQTPQLFGQGIVPFAKIFYLFEIEWEILTRNFHKNLRSYSGHEDELRQWLVGLRPRGLARTQRLKGDVHHLRLVGGPKIFNMVGLEDEWTKKMRNLLRRKPHVFIAFAWVFYMAVFSGGRWIRQQLADAGTQFWTEQNDHSQPDKAQQPPLPDLPGFSFLSFDGTQDGEELKTLFKSRFADGENVLTEEEILEIVEVAGQLFDQSIHLITELNRTISRRMILSSVPFLQMTSRSPWILVLVLPLMVLCVHGLVQSFAVHSS